VLNRLLGCLAGFVAVLFVWVFPSVSIGWQVPDRESHFQGTFSPKLEERISDIVVRGIKNGQMPGCVICVGNSRDILFLKSFGLKSKEPAEEPMSDDTIFDLASLTKPVATASAIVKLMENGQLNLDDPVSVHLKAFGQKGKEQITILDCLVHRSGLIPDNALADYMSGPEIAWENIYKLPLHYPRGEQFKYSDVNFLVLGKIVEVITGLTLDQYVRNEILVPCDMVDSSFHIDRSRLDRIAPTEKRDGDWIRGTVHDLRANSLGGVAGHAGLFSTARDLSSFSRMILNRGIVKRADGSSVLVFKEESVEAMFRVNDVHGDIRGLGWDMQSRYSSNKGKKLSNSSIGHGGFTGTVLWIDREKDLYFCFLSNRLHPDGKGNINPLAGELWDAVCEEMSPP